MTINLIVGTILFLISIAVELFVLDRVYHRKIPWKEIVVNVNSGLMLIWILKGLTLVAYYFIYQHSPISFISGWSRVSQIIFTVFAWDFCYYWSHRTHHSIPILWKLHSVHHQGEHFSLSLGIRNSWFQPLTSFPFFIPLALVGVPLEILVAVSSVHYFIQFYNHNGLVNKSGFLEYFMVTPSHHRVHHGLNPEYVNRNHGGSLVIWDKLFGSFQAERSDIQIRYGTEDGNNSDNTFLANVLPFADYFGIKVKKENEALFNLPNWFIVSGAVLLYSFFLFYVNFERDWKLPRLIVLSSLVFFGTVFLGEIAQGKKSGMLGWCSIAVCSGMILIFDQANLNIWAGLLLILMITHAVIGVFVDKKA